MLMADPAVLSNLIDRYESLREALATGPADSAGAADESHTELRRRIDDVSYTLCVSTGTRDIAAAVAAACRRVDASGRPAAGGAPFQAEVTLVP